MLNSRMTEVLQNVYNEALDQYTKKMEQACRPETRSMTQESIRDIHYRERAAARASYSNKAKGINVNSHDIEHHLAQLTEDINKREQQYFDQNVAKTEKTIRNSIDAFYKEIERITQGNALCLNSLDVDLVHAGAIQAAEIVFDADRSKGYGPDWDRHYLMDYLASKVIEYRLLNTKNNRHIGLELALTYFQDMVDKCTREPRLSVEAFNKEHEKARAKVLAEFATKRNRPKQFSNDILKFKVEQSIMIQYSQLKQINSSAGSKSSFLQSVAAYDQNALAPSALWQYCLHPDDLKKNHDEALCRALRVFRPNRTCSEGFHDSEKEERDLHLIFENRFIALADINSFANQVAEEAGFLEFRFKFNTLANANGNNWYSMSMSKRRECHGKAIVVGLNTFYAKRRDKKHEAADSYRDHLLERCKNYAQVDQ